MKKGICSSIVALIGFVWCPAVGPAIFFGEDPPGQPVHQHPDWPMGLADLLTRGGRIYSCRMGWLGGEEHSFYFRGDTDDFNWFVEQYAELKNVSRTVGVHPGRGEARRITDKQPVGPFDWTVRVMSHLTNSPKRLEITLDLWVGGQVELSKVKVPTDVKLGSSGEIERPVAVQRATRRQAEKTRARIEPTGPPAASEEPKGAKPGPDGSSGTAEADDRVVLRSKKPVYAKVALNEDGSKVLSVMYDESGGTGKGYDLLYADVNFNGRFENDERFEEAPPPSVRSYGLIPVGWLSNTFQPIILHVPYNEKGGGIPNPIEVVFAYQRYQVLPRGAFITSFGQRSDEITELLQVIERVGPKRARTLEDTPVGRAVQPQMREEFSVRCLIRLSQDSETWEYFFKGSIEPSESLALAPVWTFTKKPTLKVETRPDGRTQGNLGIGLELSAGDRQFECKKEGEPPKAHVEIKKLDGTVVHEGDDDLGKFRFG